jgi:hypothetical protein
METMRRHLIAFAALSFLGTMIGCNHTAGVCDCDAGCGAGGCGAGPAAPGILRPEPLRMPKEEANAKPVALPIEKAASQDIAIPNEK